MRVPCNNCPWRRDAPAGYWDPEHFISVWRHCQDDGQHVMLCHKATALPEDERSGLVCQGWIRVMGYDAIGVRLAVMRKRATVEEVDDKRDDLFDTFEEMLRANGIEPPERNRWRERE